ncbi:ribonuclease HII [Meridianimarinicoccus aquatilis]|uniref:Ribonuclease HII n=1 Tax=Meridianimarinicoccus aquatilis TaxID=2552766 RepID=A0A4R6APN4_9RHOB|nr:ribonuclease HII [Fluviibacterium aquatile]TDL85777.1 ribonuclease HII [Fluviibacterium aquatile]
MQTKPDFTFELSAMKGGARHIAGLDEVGRGPLAGPVTAAAVILNPDDIPSGLNDSKKLTDRRRRDLAERINATAQVCIVHVSVAEIDKLNILRASHVAMVQAAEGLNPTPDHLLIDGNMLPKGLQMPAECIVKGDARSLSIAAASIVAKVARDALMADLAAEFPGYGWERNAGYPTAAHRAALKTLGVTPHHRRSFAPIHNILYPDINLTS